MLKLSILLPNNAQINLESEDEVVIDRILGIVLADVTRALLAGMSSSEPAVGERGSSERAVSSPASDTGPAVTVSSETIPQSGPPSDVPLPSRVVEDVAATEEPTSQFNLPLGPQGEQHTGINESQVASSWEQEMAGSEPAPGPWPQSEAVGNGLGASNGSPAVGANHLGMSNLVPAVSEQAFVDFCRAANPLGDMRRVVVAAEGASRYLAMDGVDAESLGRLFDTVGWPRAHNFVQTLRNAARSKFGWLERIPGRAGHYTVTDLGRSTALGR